ncbi:hypothetical protein [Halopenitus persicus]|uniref:hypothetical protein n=1 Tax=Halopenitus persicus TaxID=1048396 RepID=UPI000BBAEE46|nr:hypothetical protein [Halopenitus persicus]
MTAPGTRRVKRTLELLATRTDTDRPPYLAVIDEADAARRDLERAAGFLESVGLDRLDDAIEAAAADDATDAADRGRAARSAYRDVRRAAAGDTASGDADADRPSDRDHFRSGGGTAKRRTAQGSEQ